MNRQTLVWALSLGLLAMFATLVMLRMRNRPDPIPATAFVEALDLDAFEEIAVQDEGRIKSFRSHASGTLTLISGARKINSQPHAVTYLDFMFRPLQNADVDAVYVKNKPMRQQVRQALMSDQRISREPGFEARMDRFMKTGLISDRLLGVPAVEVLLVELGRDLKRTARLVNSIETGRFVKRDSFLRDRLRVVPPASGNFDDRWLTIDEHIAAAAGGPNDDPDAEAARQIAQAWNEVARGWNAQDADAVNDAIARVAGLLPSLKPEAYPAATRVGWPWSLQGASAWSWISAIVILILGAIAMIMGSSATRWTGIVLFVSLLSFHAVALWLNGAAAGATASIVDHPRHPLSWESWYFAWKNLTWVWMLYVLCLVPLLMSVIYRWKRARTVGMIMFLVAFALHTFAVLLRWYVADRWPNSNMFEAVTTSAWLGGAGALLLEAMAGRTAMRGLFVMGSAVASMVALMCAHFLPVQLNPNIGNMMPVLHDVWLYIHTNVIIFSYALIFMAAVMAIIYMLYRLGGGKADYARAGGAASMIETRPDGETPLPQKANVAQVLDGATMVLMELAFLMLWAGLVMGAIWADHSWGRPWGWDPKEVFALNTFIILAVLIHVRLKVKDKGLWTAVLAVIGALVMLFNWIFINFYIVGLHSYA